MNLLLRRIACGAVALAVVSPAAATFAQTPAANAPAATAASSAMPRSGRGANPDAGQGANRTISPEVSEDRRITFRLQAAGAKSVQLLGDFTGETVAMTKDEKGVWSYTTAALRPGYYQYWFNMDGLVMPDPLNTCVRPASGVYKSQVDVPGPGTEWMDFRNVPHGVLNEHWYTSNQNATARRVVIYTPPGYRHDYQIWRIYFRDLAARLFRE
jgi:1,4-alpha-glucan branching enzyme